MRDKPARTSTPYKDPKESPANSDISADSRFFRVPSRPSLPHPLYSAPPVAQGGGGGNQPPQPPRGQEGQWSPLQPSSSSSSSSSEGSDASRRMRFRPGHPRSHDYLQPPPGGHGGRPSGGGGSGGGGRGGRGGGGGGGGGGPPGPFQPGPIMPRPWGEFRGNPPHPNRRPPGPPGPNPPAGVQVAPQQGPQAFHLAPYHFNLKLK